MAVSRQTLQQAAPDGLHHVEGRVQRAQEPLPGLLGHLDDIGTSFTQADPGDQRRGRERPGRGAVDVRGVGHQEGRVLAEAGGHSDMVDAEEAAARERDVPRRLLGEHRGGPPGSRAPQAALCAARSPPAPEPGLHRPAGPSVAAYRQSTEDL